jgi:heme/copper-type cytochrome/quinol oxidase subunit 2
MDRMAAGTGRHLTKILYALRMRSATSMLVVVALLVTACGAESESTTATTTTTTAAESTTTTTATTTTGATTTTSTEPADPYTFEIGIEGSTVTGGGRIAVPVGETVTLLITSDIDDQVHIHGYDLFVDLEAGVTAEVSFAADIPGVVEIETHEGALVVATLEAS